MLYASGIGWVCGESNLENRNIKDAVLHTQYLLNEYPINVIEFGKHLMENLKPIYRESSMKKFGRDMYELWEKCRIR